MAVEATPRVAAAMVVTAAVSSCSRLRILLILTICVGYGGQGGGYTGGGSGGYGGGKLIPYFSQSSSQY